MDRDINAEQRADFAPETEILVGNQEVGDENPEPLRGCKSQNRR
jgi:hypothetical protein